MTANSVRHQAAAARLAHYPVISVTASRYSARRDNSGFTITELMIALTLGLILITGMISVFTGSKRSATLNSAMSDMQESARFAIEAISRDARMAGFQGCIDVNTSSAIIRADEAPTSNLYESVATGSVVVSATTWAPDPPQTFQIPSGSITPVAGTHTLSLQFGSQVVAQLSGPMFDAVNSLAAPIPISKNIGNLQENDLAIISNCDVADLFRITAAPAAGATGDLEHHPSANRNSGNLSRAYGGTSTIGDTRVMKFNANVYFIGTTGEENKYGDPIRSLYLQTLPYDDSNPPTELVEGIENMRIRFGIRQSNGSMAYFAANESGYDSRKVETVQLGFLMSSIDRIRNENDTQTYVLAGQEIPAGTGISQDGLTHSNNTQYRLVFNTSVKVRNRRDKEI